MYIPPTKPLSVQAFIESCESITGRIAKTISTKGILQVRWSNLIVKFPFLSEKIRLEGLWGARCLWRWGSGEGEGGRARERKRDKRLHSPFAHHAPSHQAM